MITVGAFRTRSIGGLIMNKVTKKRKELGLTVEELAERLSLPVETVQMWEEKGKIPFITEHLILPKLEADGQNK